MNVLSILKRRFPDSIKRNLRKHSSKSRLASILSPYLPGQICIDVGASYYPHGRWHIMLESPATHWVAVEPNAQNLTYVHKWPYPSQVQTVNIGLSEDGGPKTLYVTNVDSGSSLLEPIIGASMRRRVRNFEYLYPVQKKIIDTCTLAHVLTLHTTSLPAFVKLDTQGTELSILRGAHTSLAQHLIVGIELEATLQADPVMRGAGKFWEVCQYLEPLGYELLDIKPIFGPSRMGRAKTRGRTFLNECDSVFALRQDIAAEQPVGHRAALLAFYLCYQLFEDALSLLEEDVELCDLLHIKGCDTAKLCKIIQAMT